MGELYGDGLLGDAGIIAVEPLRVPPRHDLRCHGDFLSVWTRIGRPQKAEAQRSEVEEEQEIEREAATDGAQKEKAKKKEGASRKEEEPENAETPQ